MAAKKKKEKKDTGVDAATLKKERDDATTQANDFKEKLAWLQAEYENYQKRAAREREAACRRTADDLLLSILGVRDTLERALAAAKTGPQDNALVDGVTLTLTQLDQVLERQGVSRIDAKGAKFDPDVHDAMLAEPTGDHPEDHVIEELEAGYRVGERVLRPAKVKVAVKKED